MTFAEFEQLGDPPGGKYELHHGELITVAPPKLKHYHIQRRLRRLLEAADKGASEIDIEMAFRPKPEHEYWHADVGLISAERWEQTDPEGNIQGVPELVVEVLSRSNTAAEILDKRLTCLENGAREFWLVNPARSTVEVSTPDGHSITYNAGGQIPLFFGGSMAVDDIFR